jgi:N-acetylneuraminate synthase
MTHVDIAGRKVGPGWPCFVIAEAGVNHNGDLGLARKLIDAAAESGADAVKFQSFQADKLVTKDAVKANYQTRNTDAGESQLDMLRRLELSAADHRELVAHCRRRGVLFMSTPFDDASADLLDELDVPVYKMPSGEVTNLPFLAHVARKRRPMIVSTGMTTLGEVEAAVQTLEAAGNPPFVLLHCVSNYPADPADVNLRAMQTMATAFGRPTGYSDHTLGDAVTLAAVALGACVIEKHFTLDRNLPGPDHQASLEPAEIAALVRSIRVVEAALGDGRKRPAASEANTAAVARKSLVAAADIPAGASLTEKTIAIKRPGTGLPPAMRPLLVGKTARRDIRAGTLLTLEMVT